jgi:hypothetical protein
MRRMYGSRIAAMFGFAVLVTMAAAAPVERDLGQGLVYYRLHALPGDLPAAQGNGRQACVLDLRYASGDVQGAAALSAWLRFHAGPHSPVFVVANAETAAPLLAALAGPERSPGVLRVGIASDAFQPDSAVSISAVNEHRAYDAFEHGTALAVLLTEHPEKARNDEASLAKDRPVEAPPDSPEGAKAAAAAPPIDAALQRAVQLHRALVALRKI